MKKAKGAYIAIEGITGSGKSTLVQMLARELQAAGTPVLTIAAADKPSDLTAQTITRIVEDPRYPLTTEAEVLLYNAVRAQSLDKIRASIEAGVTCIVDQSYLSVLVQEYYGRGSITDYSAADEIIRFATSSLQPDLIIVLDTPVNTARGRLPKNTTPEFSEPQLERVRAGYLWEAKQRNIPVVYANDPVETVFEHVKSHARNVIDTLHSVSDTNHVKQEVTSVAEVLAGHSVSSKTAETTLPQRDKQEALAKPVETTTTQKMPSLSLKQGSVLLQANLMQGGFTLATPAQLHVNQKDKSGRYSYYVPDGLQGKLRSNYTRTLNQIFETYGRLHAELVAYLNTASDTPKAKRTSDWRASINTTAHEALQTLVPLAATTAIEIEASKSTLSNALTQLAENDLPEARSAAHHIVNQARSQNPALATRQFAEAIRTHTSNRDKAHAAFAQLAQSLLPNNHANPTQNVTLVSYTPRNEMDGVADMLYEHSDMSLRDLKQTVATWQYEQKLTVLKAYASKSKQPGNAFRAVTYTFDVVSDYQVFNEICRASTAQQIAWQMITPRMGYETPNLIEQAGLSEMYAQCFDLSLLLHSELQAAGTPQEAQYAALRGHKIRWTVRYSAQDILSALGNTPIQSPAREVLDSMWADVADVHPLLTEAFQATTTDTTSKQPVRS